MILLDIFFANSKMKLKCLSPKNSQGALRQMSAHLLTPAPKLMASEFFVLKKVFNQMTMSRLWQTLNNTTYLEWLMDFAKVETKWETNSL